MSSELAYEIAPHLGFLNFCVAPTDGIDDGVWMLWNTKEIEVEYKY